MSSTPEIVPFTKSSRSEAISDYVKECIINGIWKTGERIDDLKLSKQIGVSRLTVREALSRLVENRVLSQVHWRGFYVRTLSWKEIESIVEMREVLEILAVEKFMERADEPLLKELADAIPPSEKDLEEGDRRGFFSSDFLFHEVLYKNSGNEWIVHFSRQIMFFVDLLRVMDKKRDYEQIAKTTIADHKTLLEVIRRGDRKEAGALMKDHIERFRERLRDSYEAATEG